MTIFVPDCSTQHSVSLSLFSPDCQQHLSATCLSRASAAKQQAACMWLAKAASSSWDHLSLLCPPWLLSMAGTKWVLSLGNKEPAQIWLSGSKLGTTLNKTHRRGGTALTPAFLWLVKAPATLKQLRKPTTCVIMTLNSAFTFDKRNESNAWFIGSESSCSAPLTFVLQLGLCNEYLEFPGPFHRS